MLDTISNATGSLAPRPVLARNLSYLEDAREICARIIEIPADKISGETSLASISADSLLLEIFTMEIEEWLGQPADRKKIRALKKVQDLAYLLFSLDACLMTFDLLAGDQ